MKPKVKLSKKEIKEEIKTILKGSYPDEAIVKIGENRGQLFIRIPKIVSERLDLHKGQKLKLKTWTKRGKKPKVEIIPEK